MSPHTEGLRNWAWTGLPDGEGSFLGTGRDAVGKGKWLGVGSGDSASGGNFKSF